MKEEQLAEKKVKSSKQQKPKATSEKSAPTRGKKYLSALANIETHKFYANTEALKKVKTLSYTKFDGTIPTYKDNTPLGCSDESCYFVGTHNVTMVPIEVNTCPVCGKYLS